MLSAADRVRALGCWTEPVEPEPLEGGITNTNFVVRHRGEEFVVRIGEDIPVHQVSRANELAAARAAHAAGISPEIVHHEHGALVMRRIHGRTLGPEDIRRAETLARILPLLQSCHRRIPMHFRGPAPMFWVFQVLRDYRAGLEEGGSRLRGELPELMARAEILEAAVGPIQVVFGHNDLLAANFIDDGERIWLVDWEYAGFNSPLFDLGGLASNNEFDADQERWLLQAYFHRPPDAGLWRRYQAMKCASLLREALWSMISEIHSTLDFDYRAYTTENLGRFEKAWADFQDLETAEDDIGC